MKNLEAKHDTPLKHYARSLDLAKAIEKGYSVIDGKVYEKITNVDECELFVFDVKVIGQTLYKEVKNE